MAKLFCYFLVEYYPSLSTPTIVAVRFRRTEDCKLRKKIVCYLVFEFLLLLENTEHLDP